MRVLGIFTKIEPAYPRQNRGAEGRKFCELHNNVK